MLLHSAHDLFTCPSQLREQRQWSFQLRSLSPPLLLVHNLSFSHSSEVCHCLHSQFAQTWESMWADGLHSPKVKQWIAIETVQLCSVSPQPSLNMWWWQQRWRSRSISCLGNTQYSSQGWAILNLPSHEILNLQTWRLENMKFGWKLFSGPCLPLLPCLILIHYRGQCFTFVSAAVKPGVEETRQ